MSIVRIRQDDKEIFSIDAAAKREFSARELDASDDTYDVVTGTVSLFPNASTYEKEVRPTSLFLDSDYKEGVENNFDDMFASAKDAAVASGSNNEAVQNILDRVNDIGQSARKLQTVDIIRFEPPVTFNKDFARKRIVREVLYPFYRSSMPSLHWAYSNYHTLNFFATGSVTDADYVASDTVLMYPNVGTSGTVATNVYLPQGAFTLDMRINPRYQTGKDVAFGAGTILHMSGAYALSLVSGSSRDENGEVDRFRLLFQVLSGTLQTPTVAHANVDTTEEVFISNDNVLKRNHWHRVVVRWGTNIVNEGSGSMFVDGVNVGNFVIASSTIAQQTFSPDILYVGNFYEGSTDQAKFFSPNVALRDGVHQLTTDTDEFPSSYNFGHPLRAEVHELRIWDKFLTGDQFASSSLTTPQDLGELLFYVPPYFTPESPRRSRVGGLGGVLQTPFFAVSGTTDDPFNVAMSFGVGGHYLNLENFTREFVNANYPRAWALTGSQQTTVDTGKSANTLLYEYPEVRKRNLTVLPCDDGQFTPSFSLLLTGSETHVPTSGTLRYKHTNDIGSFDPSLISLTEMIATSSLDPTLLKASGSTPGLIALKRIRGDKDAVRLGPTPEEPGVAQGITLTIFQRTRDASSNEVTLFDISDLYYGRRIDPETFVLKDVSVTGSAGQMSITLKDDGRGSLYRADADTEHAKWANVGDIIYDEGIVVVKTPNIPRFGREGFDVEFNARSNVHTMKVSVVAGAGMFNSSSNPTFRPLSSSLDANEYDPEFVYITGINFHDKNMNVVMRSTLAQPVMKRTGDRLKFVTKLDM